MNATKVACLTIALFGCKADPEVVSHDLVPAVSASASASAAEAEAEINELLKAPTLSAAFEKVRPLMKDQKNTSSLGTFRLGIWAMNHLAFDAVNVASNETSLALIHKDPEEERGKRLCLDGEIVEIKVERPKYGKAAVGILITPARDLVHFVAVGSTGTLVARSRARYCGITTGLYEYSNSSGGTGHAIDSVGMFDLPENKTAPSSPSTALSVKVRP